MPPQAHGAWRVEKNLNCTAPSPCLRTALNGSYQSNNRRLLRAPSGVHCRADRLSCGEEAAKV
jgi:hypothetical protein